MNTPSKVKTNILRLLNDYCLPWADSRFVIDQDEFEFIGSGGFSEVYAMENVSDTSKKYAVKIIGFHDDRRIHLSELRPYLKEPILQQKLSEKCSSVVKVIDTQLVAVKLDEKGDVEDIRVVDELIEQSGWLLLLLIKMERLKPIIKQSFSGDYSITIPELARIDEKEILLLAMNVAEALAISHEMNVMHRDVKLENIFYDEASGRYKLGDFGIARITNEGSSMTKGAGTDGYMAPEVDGSTNSENYTCQADIYSFGITMYLLLNELKFPGSTECHRVNRSIQYNPKATIDTPMNGSAKLKKLICTLLKYNPSGRPKAMSDVLASLKKIYNGVGSEKNVVKRGEFVENREESGWNYADVVMQEDSVGQIVAEVREESLEQETWEQKGIEDPRSGVIKGILGTFLLVAGLLYFAMLMKDSPVVLGNPKVLCSAIICTIVSSITYIVRFSKKNKLISFRFAYIIVFVFSIYVMLTGGWSWFYLIFAIGLLLGSVTENFAMSLSVCGLFFLGRYNVGELSGGIFNEKLVWLVLMAAIVGFLLIEQYDSRETLLSVLTSDEVAGFLVMGAVALIMGGIIWLINLVPVISVPRILLNMHFVYVGAVLLIVGFVNLVRYDGKKAKSERD